MDDSCGVCGRPLLPRNFVFFQGLEKICCIIFQRADYDGAHLLFHWLLFIHKALQAQMLVCRETAQNKT